MPMNQATLAQIEQIKRLIDKLKLVYTLEPSHQEEALVSSVLDTLELNLSYFDENGKLIK